MHHVPAIGLTGYLGSGKTTLLNHLLRQDGARIGVVVNDFGAINVDAALVEGQVGSVASFAGGCLCCIEDESGLDEALDKLSHPRFDLDAILIEASSIAEPPALAHLLRYSGAERIRPGGIVEVIDAREYFTTVDTGGPAPGRFVATPLVVINKADLLPDDVRDETCARIEARVHERNPSAHVVRVSQGRVDPSLVYDVAHREPPDGQLTLDLRGADREHHHHDHETRSASLDVPHAIDPGRVIDLLEEPPDGAYRIKGTITVETPRGARSYVVHLVGTAIHISTTTAPAVSSLLVIIGTGLDPAAAEHRLEQALARVERPRAEGFSRLQRYRRLSL